ncbi:HNH endonuclease [Undibacterium sp. TJN19]|uniref:HNH endonuclease n=1 Tax=Undibacterium sp. TJN19 TaxID=3413055 RepID=UPI003BF3C5D9
MQQILVLDIAGTPYGWMSPNDAASYYAADKVAWEIGEQLILLRGGTNMFGQQSKISVKPVISIKNSDRMSKSLRHHIPLGDGNRLLYARDKYFCAYCGEQYASHDLSRDHILARSRGGRDVWENCVTACRRCNQAKGSKLVHDFKPLIYVPYAPCRFEHFILSGRNVIADQLDYLSAKLPRHSRLL